MCSSRGQQLWPTDQIWPSTNRLRAHTALSLGGKPSSPISHMPTGDGKWRSHLLLPFPIWCVVNWVGSFVTQAVAASQNLATQMFCGDMMTWSSWWNDHCWKSGLIFKRVADPCAIETIIYSVNHLQHSDQNDLFMYPFDSQQNFTRTSLLRWSANVMLKPIFLGWNGSWWDSIGEKRDKQIVKVSPSKAASLYFNNLRMSV